MSAYEKNLDKLVRQINKIIKNESEMEQILNQTLNLIKDSDIKLYKYLFLEKHSSNASGGCEVTLDVEKLSFDKIFFNSFDNLNDPFENIQLKRLEASQSEKFRTSPKLYFNDPISNILQQFPKKREGIDALNAMLSLSCFTTNHPRSKKSMLMWSHYARSHKGVCYEYDIKDIIQLEEIKKKYVYLLPVKYISTTSYDKLVQLHSSIFTRNQSQIMSKSYDDPDIIAKISKEYIRDFMLSILEKYSDSWKYENEWRLVHARNNKALTGIKPINIYAGAKMSSADYAAINKRCLSELGKQTIKVNIEDFMNE